MSPIEMARRLRHDLIKHLEIPAPHAQLSAAQAQFLLRRLFDSGTGICKLAHVLAFKFRRDPEWDEALEASISAVEKAAHRLEQSQSAIVSKLKTDFSLNDDACALIESLVEAVHGFERECEQFDIAPQYENLESSAFDYFGFSSENESKEVSCATEENAGDEKRRILVVDDHLMLIDRLQANAAFIKRFTWATLCDRQAECITCPEHENCAKRRARNAAEAIDALRRAKEKNKRVDVILMDVRFDSLPSEELLRISEDSHSHAEERVKSLQGLIIVRYLRQNTEFSTIPIVLMTAKSRLPDGAKSLLQNMSGLQFVDDEDSLDALAARIESVVKLSREIAVEQGYFWGTSKRVLTARQQIEIMSQGPRTMLITGPSGSGKSSLVEKIIYPLSKRSPLITLDLSAVPETLIESELFGHVKGAYSGAVSDRVGLIEEADGGVLFLDEIGNLSSEIQQKLLIFLQNKMVRRVGATFQSSRHVDVKVVVATSRDLEQEVKEGKFRFDLYMRFAPAMRIELPALRERRADLPEFVEMLVHKTLNSNDMKPYLDAFKLRTKTDGHFRVDFNRNDAKVPENWGCVRFRSATRDLFMAYDWPGNTRELESIIDTLLLKALYDLFVANSSSRIVEIDPYYALSLFGEIDQSASESLQHGNPLEEHSGESFDIGICSDFSELRQTLEKKYLSHVYEACQGDLAKMGKRLFSDDSEAMRHRIAIRMNQLGLSLRRLKKTLMS